MAKIAQKLPLDIYGALRPAVQRSQHKRVVFLVSSCDSKQNWMMFPKKLFWAKKLLFWLQKRHSWSQKGRFGHTEPKNGCQPLNIVTQRVPGIIQYHHQPFSLEDDSEFFLMKFLFKYFPNI